MTVEILKALALPPTSLFLLLLFITLCTLAGRGRRRLLNGIGLAALALTLLLSLPAVSDRLLYSLYARIQPLPAIGPLDTGAQAIVILSAELREREEDNRPGPGPLTLERLRYGAHLFRRTGLPVLVAGGRPAGRDYSLAEAMRISLSEDFSVPVAWSEALSLNTHENAAFSAPILLRAGVTRIILVTHAWHMPRAVREFEKAGLEVVPAPTEFLRPGPFWTLNYLLPTPKALLDSYYAAHEAIGGLFYSVMAR